MEEDGVIIEINSENGKLIEGGVMKSLNESFYKIKCSISIIERKGFDDMNDSKRSSISIMKNLGVMDRDN